MLYPIFNEIRKRLEEITELKSVQWFNAQYDGVIYIQPAVFVEFSQALSITEITSSDSQASISIRLHVVSASIAAQDGSVPDEQITTHESLAHKVLDKLKGEQLTLDGTWCTSLCWSGWQHYHKYKGWMITLIELNDTALIQLE